MADAEPRDGLPRVAFACSPNPWFDHPEATPHRQAVLRALIRLAGRGYSCNPTREKIIEVAKVGRKKVIEAIQWWSQVGAIAVEPDPDARSRRRFVFQWRRAEGRAPDGESGAPDPTPMRAHCGRASAPDPTPMRAHCGRASAPRPDLFSQPPKEMRPDPADAPLQEKREREEENVSSRPSQGARATAPPSDRVPDETRRDASISRGGEGEAAPARRPADPRRIDDARRLRDRLLDEHGYQVRADADRSDVELVPVPHLRRHLDEPDPGTRAMFDVLRPELLAIALGGQAVAVGSQPPPSPRDPEFPLEAAEAIVLHDAEPGTGLRLMLMLCGRWHDRPTVETRNLFEDAADLLPRERLLRRVREADGKHDPAHWFASTIARDLWEARGRPPAGRWHRPPGQRGSTPRGPVERQSA